MAHPLRATYPLMLVEGNKSEVARLDNHVFVFKDPVKKTDSGSSSTGNISIYVGLGQY